MNKLRRLFWSSIALLTLASSRSWAEDWPQFRGPNASGVYAGSHRLPTTFSHEQNVRWSVELGEGIPSPVVAGGRVFTTAMVGPQKFAVFAFDESTGKQLWRRELDTGPLPPIMPPNSHASSTPAADVDRVVVYFSTLGLLAFNAANGEQIWHVLLDVPQYLMDWGAAGSPIILDDMVIFDQDDDLAPFLIAVEKKSGQVLWRTERAEMLAGYAVPVICEAGGRKDIVIAGTGKMKGYDPATGKERWTCNTLLRTIMTSPVVRDGVIYISVQSYGDTERILKFALLEWKDTNQDGKLTKEELPKTFGAKFDKADANHDGYLVDKEIDHAFQSPTNMAGGGSIIQAIRGGGYGDVTKTHLAWNLNNRSPSNLSSPIVFGNQLLVVKRGGIASSFDAETGKAHWETKRIGNLGEYYSSPIAGDGKIYLTGENGFVVVLAPGPELKVLAKNDIGGTCIATPAIANGRIFFRTREKLLCVEGK